MRKVDFTSEDIKNIEYDYLVVDKRNDKIIKKEII